mgnify:CR=1 FL=1
MKKSLELKETRSGLVDTLESIKTTADGESRNLNEAEATEVDSTLDAISALDVKIERAEKMEKELRAAASVSGAKIETPNKDKDLDGFTFQGACRAAYSGKPEGLYKELHQEAVNESRYTGVDIKGVGIPASVLTRAFSTTSSNSTETMSFTDQLEKNLVLASAGANTYFGVNDMKFPVFSGITSTWVSEDGTSGAAASAGDMTSLTLTPKKLISVVNMTSEAMMQNASLEGALQRNMARQIAASLEYALLDTGDVSQAPQSIFADATAGPVGVTAADFVQMETDALALGVEREGSRLAYLLDMDAYKAAKTLAQVAGVSPLYDNSDRRLNGYFSFQSGNVAASGTADKAHALFGDFSKVHIAQFGGLDLLLDPYTLATTGQPRMIVTSLVDGNAVQNASFIKMIEA